MRGCVVAWLVVLAGCDLIFVAGDDDNPAGDAGADVDAIIDPPPPAMPFLPMRDFDGDGDVDNVDPCPLDPDIKRDAVDTDRDGLADGCDPDLNSPAADCILLLDYFFMDNFASAFPWEPDGWIVSKCDGNNFAFCSPMADGTSTLRFDVPLPVARVEAEISMTARRTGGTAKIQLFAGLDPAHDAGRACTLRDDGSGLIQLAVDDVAAGKITTADVGNTGVMFDEMVQRTIRWTPQGDDTAAGRACELPDLNDINIDAPPAPPPAGAFVALRATDSDVRLNYIVVYGSKCR